MITRVVLENFKRFPHQEFILNDVVVLAGPNNTGKSTLLQALATWSLALDTWRLGRGRSEGAKIRRGQPVTRKDFTALPLREFDLLWTQRRTAKSKSELAEDEKPGEPRLIHIAVHGTTGLSTDDPWHLTMELRYQSQEQIYVKPVKSSAGEAIPKTVEQFSIVHCPPFSGIGAEEKHMDRGAQNLEIGRGKPGDTLRNLLLEVSRDEDKSLWDQLKSDIQELFGYTLLRPDYDELKPFILCEYQPSIPSGKARGSMQAYDIASGGSGFHQVLLLLSLFYARPASVLLLDEPDAHLHVILQRMIYEHLRVVAAKRASQLIVATHSEVILDSTPFSRVLSFLGDAPHPLVSESQRDKVREAMARLTTLDLLLAEQGRAVLYCEGDSDFKILRAFAEVLKHKKALRFLDQPFFHPIGGRNPREAKAHLFALSAIHPSIRGLLLLDGDNRGLPEHELATNELTIMRWGRYEIENYLLIPSAIRALLAPHDEKALQYLRAQLPPATFSNPLEDNATVNAVRASKDVLPQMFQAAGRPMEKQDFFLIAKNMNPGEIHSDVVRVLDAIGNLLPPDTAQ